MILNLESLTQRDTFVEQQIVTHPIVYTDYSRFSTILEKLIGQIQWHGVDDSAPFINAFLNNHVNVQPLFKCLKADEKIKCLNLLNTLKKEQDFCRYMEKSIYLAGLSPFQTEMSNPSVQGWYPGQNAPYTVATRWYPETSEDYEKIGVALNVLSNANLEQYSELKNRMYQNRRFKGSNLPSKADLNAINGQLQSSKMTFNQNDKIEKLNGTINTIKALITPAKKQKLKSAPTSVIRHPKSEEDQKNAVARQVTRKSSYTV